MRVLPQPGVLALGLADVLHALGDPVRLEIIHRLAADGEVTCAPEGMDIPKSTMSNHWRILREGGITTTVVDGRHRRMSLRRDELEQRFPGVLTAILAAAGTGHDLEEYR